MANPDSGRRAARGGPRGADIKTQINLPWSKAIEIALNALKIRFGRSLITAGGIFLSIAFLGYSCVPLLIEEHMHTLAGNQETYRQVWLVTMALLVTVIGIMNSMLMSVSERFREIGTMKCLGALDSLVLRLFLIEAVFMGVISSFAGWILGFLAIAVVNAIEGQHHLTFGISMESFGICLGTGVVLTFIAAMLPARRAAQMPPAAALRSEV